MKRLLLPLLAAISLPTAVFSHHGPFSNEDNSENHQLHLGITQTTNPNGVEKSFESLINKNKRLH